MLGRARRTGTTLEPSKPLPEASVTWFREDNFRYRDAKSKVARYSGDGPSPQASNLSEPASFRDHSVHVDDEADWDVSNLNAVEEPLERTYSHEKELTEVKEAFLLVEVPASSSMTDIADSALGRILTVIAGDTSFNEWLQFTNEFFTSKIEHDRSAA